MAHVQALPLAVGTAAIAVDLVAVVALFGGLHDVVATELDPAVGAAAVEIDVVAVVALFATVLHDAVTAVLCLASGAAAVTVGSVPVVALLAGLRDAVTAEPSHEDVRGPDRPIAKVHATVGLGDCDWGERRRILSKAFHD
jgi:hypothetical protein